ncbi:MAG: ATP-dependent 6-phosphofructokinase [Chloroflexi bacterium]|nr:ATP-dependent 6-phosphofructokinase [Chloroflexota bacterium]
MIDQTLRRVGILTAGGDCPGLNAVIRAFVMTAEGFFSWENVGILDGFEGLLMPEGTRPLTTNDVRGILPLGGTILGTSNRCNPFAFRTLTDGEECILDRSAEVMEKLSELDIGALVVIGGDGSMNIGLKLAALGVPIVGVPKTIDNDLAATDVTFGFNTAVTTATDALDRLRSTAEAHHRVMILEVMGRDAGWIALEAGLAGDGHIILIPEIPFQLQKVAQAIEHRSRSGRTYSIIVVAEGAYPAGGEKIVQRRVGPDGFPRLGGIGVWLAEELGQRIRHEVRATVLGHTQRGGSPTPFDRVLATRLGSAAAWLVGAKNFGKMVALRGGDIVPVPIEDAVRAQKLVPPAGERVMTARYLGVSFGD